VQKPSIQTDGFGAHATGKPMAATNYALLGLLLERDAYAYELADRMQSRLGWDVNSGQVSQAMRLMERRRLVRAVAAPPEREHKRKDRIVYSITEKGIEAFGHWFEDDSNEPRSARVRRPLLVKINLAGGADRLAETHSQIDSYEEQCVRQLKALHTEREGLPFGEAPLRADHFLLRLGLLGDIFQLEAELAWVRTAREMVSRLLNTSAIWPSTQRRAEEDETLLARRSAQRELFARMAARDQAVAKVEMGREDDGNATEVEQR
jgi:DNA-binding PadR family transcriptional regulator